MPRTPDPHLERQIAEASLRLVDAAGIAAVTLRAVAREAGTTTPTIYERFKNREELLHRVARQAEIELLAAVRPAGTVRDFIERYVNFNLQHPLRFDLTADTFGFRLSAEHPMPVYDHLKELLQSELQVTGSGREDLAMAIASLALGTTRAIIAAGSTTPAAADLRRTTEAALGLLLKTFS